MELKVSVSEAIALIKEVENVPAKILEYIGMNIQKEVGTFLTCLMGQELTHHVGREKYERKEGATDYRNGSYTRTFCIKGVGDVHVDVPRDRDGDFQSQVLRGGPGSLDTPKWFLSDKPLLFILPFLFPAEYSSKPHQVSSRQVLFP